VSQPVTVVDAFTDRPFAGNPAAVCLLPAARDAAWMQDVAREMNLAETAFLVRANDGFDLRWFTPSVEVDLCGHATLASAHVLWERREVEGDRTARFHTRSGLLTAERKGEWIEMDFPAEPEQPVEAPADLVRGLGAVGRYVGLNRLDFLVELDSEEAVRDLRPDFRSLAALGTRGVIVTARSSAAGIDFVSRFFAPGAGIDEDPVTGSTHCCLGPFWQARLGKDELVGFQASARGGIVRVRPLGERVILAGQAVTVLRGEIGPFDRDADAGDNPPGTRGKRATKEAVRSREAVR
jgi:PhzF family phenazine biosynthesis protein